MQYFLNLVSDAANKSNKCDLLLIFINEFEPNPADYIIIDTICLKTNHLLFGYNGTYVDHRRRNLRKINYRFHRSDFRERHPL